ncbi:MAG: hypothetical protein OXI15_03720 [Chromatiales bacterium]|nr:hypothetical protein [Chromatiales bacterium]
MLKKHGCYSLAVSLPSQDHCMEADQQNSGQEGLSDEVAGTCFEDFDLGLGLVAPGQDEDREKFSCS